MAPLPKRKHSTARKGRRMSVRSAETSKSMPQLIKCPNCGKKKLPHRVCKYCGK